jgi:DNA-binding protein HU-beta
VLSPINLKKFYCKKRALKKARDIAKNKEIIVPEHYIPDFKPSVKLSDLVKNNVKKIPFKSLLF